MTDIVPVPNWGGVRQLETNEYATGGLNGNMNEQAKSLAGQNMYSRLYAGLPFDPVFTAQVGGFPIGGRAALDNGDIVRSTVANNTVDPNVDMTGWVKTNDASQIFDGEKSQEGINKKNSDFIGNSVTPEMFYNGEATWDNAFKLAQEASAHIILQAGKTYPISKTIINTSGVTWDCNWARIVNPMSDPSNINWHVFGLGNMHPASFNYSQQGTGQYLPCYNVDNVESGSNKITLIDPSKANNFTVGSFAWVRTIAETSNSGVNIPSYAQLVKVKKIEGASILFETLISEEVQSACISPMGMTTDPATGLKWFIAENVIIKNLNVNARYLTWTRTGTYNCKINNIDVRGGDGLLALNTFNLSEAKNITGDFKVRMLELKCCTHDSVLEDISATCNPQIGLNFLGGLDIGEQSRNLNIKRVSCELGLDAGVMTLSGFPLDVRGRNIDIIDSVFTNRADTSGVTGNVAYIREAQFAGYGTDGIRLRNVALSGNAKRNFLLRIGDNAETIKGKNIELDVRYIGQAAVSQVSYQGADVKILNPTTGQSGQVTSNGKSPEVLCGTTELSVSDFDVLTGSPQMILYANSTAKCWGFDSTVDEDITSTVIVPSWATMCDITGYFINTLSQSGDAVVSLKTASGARGSIVGTAQTFTSNINSPAQNSVIAVNFSKSAICVSNGVLVLRVGRVATSVADTLTGDIGFIGLKLMFR